MLPACDTLSVPSSSSTGLLLPSLSFTSFPSSSPHNSETSAKVSSSFSTVQSIRTRNAHDL
uniref:Uncharacterized protein n=1 Tax=Lepeophtheirus salmonis TaxID=72036 RepID=A0A0K2TPR9_LEPSM